MGSRGAFDSSMGKTGGIPVDKREYSAIGKLGNIKVIQCDTLSNNKAPTYSNTCNTTYYSYSKERNRIERIYYYRNHKLVKSVDFKDGEVPHVHKWANTVVGRKKHAEDNVFPLSARDKRLMDIALKFNKKQKLNGKQNN